MASVELSDQEWQYLLSALAERPWREVNTLVMKVGGQLQRQQQPIGAPRQQTIEETRAGIRLDGNGQEVRHE